MRGKLHPSLPFLLLGLSAACGEPDDPDDYQMNPSLTADAGLPDAAGSLPPGSDAGAVPSGVDAAVTPGVDAGPPDAGPVSMGPDSGGGSVPGHDGGSTVGSDAGRDASVAADASAGADAGASGCSLTYDSFGKQFMMKYCVGCHMGFLASHFVQLDSLSGVQSNKDAVKRMAVTSTMMPTQDPRPTSAERQQLGQWLECGPK